MGKRRRTKLGWPSDNTPSYVPKPPKKKGDPSGITPKAREILDRLYAIRLAEKKTRNAKTAVAKR